MKEQLWFQICFSELMKKYDLQFEVLSEKRIALIGETYILSFLFHMDDVNVSYIRRNANGELEEWDMNWHVGYAINDDDRKGIVPGNTMLEIRKNIVLILSRTLKRCFGDLLSGGTAWMPVYLSSWYADVGTRMLPEDRECAERHHI